MATASGRASSRPRATIVEDGGVDALSMRKLAAELGVAHTAIYWHVGGRDELIGAIVDSLVAELGDIRPRGRTPRARIASIANEIRRQVRRAPGPGRARDGRRDASRACGSRRRSRSRGR